MHRKILLLLSIAVLSCGLVTTGCEDNRGPAEKMGESMDDAMDEMGDTIEDAADEIGDAVDDATRRN